MKIIVTCGPGFEPIDEVRRLTNFSTGELGVRLALRLAEAGHDVICLKGSGATWPDPPAPCRLHHFDTNDDLLALLENLSRTEEIDALLHAAALCDYRVKTVSDERGRECRSAKIASRSGALTLQLEPATKVIHRLRELFPHSLLAGWKFELAGTRDEALARAWRQLHEARTDVCVLNGRAWGSGFAVCHTDGSLEECGTKDELTRRLTARLAVLRESAARFDPAAVPAGSR